MKNRTLSFMLSAALILGSVPFAPMQADAAAYQYEFEKGTITAAGENPAEITAVKGASGGKAVNLRDGGNKISLTVHAAEEGAHRITLRSPRAPQTTTS